MGKFVIQSVIPCAAFLVFQGCALLSSNSDVAATPGSAQGEFRTVVSTMNGPMSVPVEIANDIATITQGKTLAPDEKKPSAEFLKKDSAQSAALVSSEAPAADAPSKEPVVTAAVSSKKVSRHPASESVGQYKVKEGDTLMKIAFTKYGNVYRWKEIYEANKNVIPNLSSLRTGTVLTIKGVQYVVIRRNGSPYLIRRGDTLAKISNTVYQTPKHWPRLWHNNPELIHDPNKIYAGFTLYYEPLAKPTVREPAGADGH